MRLGVEAVCEEHPEGIALTTRSTLDGAVAWTNTQLIRLGDQAVRDALIALGWTPPKESNEPQSDRPS